MHLPDSDKELVNCEEVCGGVNTLKIQGWDVSVVVSCCSGHTQAGTEKSSRRWNYVLQLDYTKKDIPLIQFWPYTGRGDSFRIYTPTAS